MSRIIVLALAYMFAFTQLVSAAVLEVDYSLISPVTDAGIADGVGPEWQYESELKGVCLGLGFDKGPIIAGSRIYILNGFYRTAESEMYSYTEGSGGVGIRRAVAKIGTAWISVGGSVRYSRFWFSFGDEDTRSGGGSFSLVPEVQASVLINSNFGLYSTARALVYTNRPDPHGIVFPFESGILLSVGGSVRF